jgi:hypothetical protein
MGFLVTNGYIVIKEWCCRKSRRNNTDFFYDLKEKTSMDTWHTAPRAEMQMKELAILEWSKYTT